jgi:hypothetical protein
LYKIAPDSPAITQAKSRKTTEIGFIKHPYYSGSIPTINKYLFAVQKEKGPNRPSVWQGEGFAFRRD